MPLAIADDLGAVTVIAFFYIDTIKLMTLLTVIGILFLLIAINLGGVRYAIAFVLFGVVLWIARLICGVHATLAGIFLAFTKPQHPKNDPNLFLSHINSIVDDIK